MTDSGLIREYLLYAQNARGLSQATIAAQKNDLALLEELCKVQNKEILSIDGRSLQAGIDELSLRYEPASIARLCSTLRSFYAFASLRYDCKDPAHGLHTPAFHRHLPDWLDAGQMEALLDGMDGSDRSVLDGALLMVLYCCGLRVSELCTLEERNVFLDQALIRVLGKGKKERMIPLPSWCVLHLRQYREYVRKPLPNARRFFFVSLQGKPINRQYVYRLVKTRAAAGALLPAVSPHTLRHSFATRLIESGNDLRVIQELLGHSDISTTQIYTHIDTDRLSSAVESALPDPFASIHPSGKEQAKETGRDDDDENEPDEKWLQ